MKQGWSAVTAAGREMMEEEVGGQESGRDVASLFDTHYSSLRGLAFVMLGDAALAEEVVMEAFLKMHSGWKGLRKLDHPPSYLRKIVINLCRSKMRRARLEMRANALLQAGRPRDRSWDPDRHDAGMDLWTAVRALPERQRACVVLRYLEDMREAEIAETLDCSIGTVKSQLFKARAKLEQALTRGGELI